MLFTRAFFTLIFPAGFFAFAQPKKVHTVTGMIPASEMGITLPHEHILVDFIGAKKIRPGRYSRDLVIAKALPKLLALKKAGCKTFVDCTPDYLGRDVQLLKILSARSGLQIITNTGYYGASGEKYLPEQAYRKTAEQIAGRWIKEYEDGINGTEVKPGFIKLSADAAPLSNVQRKMIEAGAKAHLKTGLTIAVHSGNGAAAREELAILEKNGLKPDAFIWVHAQNEKNFALFRQLAAKGAWVSFDGLSAANTADYLAFLRFMKQHKLLHRTLISHDSGWYHVGEPGGGTFNGYTTLFDKLLPLLKNSGFTDDELNQVLRVNPAEAFAVRLRSN
ncbi:MAG: phosphotriesterase [Mucilaginibacter polytrichastri]|nr:phosphotriesterase [Mucilaginibacter polytrichastri]